MVHCLSMALPQRFTFISDCKDEFPNNTNHQFKVRLPVPLRLEGQWYASLFSLSVPDEPLQNKSLFADTSAVILDFKFTLYKLSGKSGDKYQTLTLIPKTSTLRVDNVMNNTTPAQTGVEFWQNCVRMIDETIAENVLEVKQNDSLLPVAIPNDWKPTFKWDGDDLVLEAVSSDSVVSSGASPSPYSWFAMSESLALSFGFLQYSKLFNRNILGDNASGFYPLYEEKGAQMADSILTNNPGLKGPTRAAQNTPNVDTTDPKISAYKIENGKIYFSRALQWNFRRLNESFDL